MCNFKLFSCTLSIFSRASISSVVSPDCGRTGRRKVMAWHGNIEGNSSGKDKSEFELYLEESQLFDVYDAAFNVLVCF